MGTAYARLHCIKTVCSPVPIFRQRKAGYSSSSPTLYLKTLRDIFFKFNNIAIAPNYSRTCFIRGDNRCMTNHASR